MNIPNCFQCKHRRAIPGDAHSRCAHPVVAENESPLGEVLAIFASIGRVGPRVNPEASKLKITANETGVKNGWFLWPYNFDPCWLESCEGFEQK